MRSLTISLRRLGSTAIDMLRQEFVDLTYDLVRFNIDDPLKVAIVRAVNYSLHVDNAAGVPLKFESVNTLESSTTLRSQSSASPHQDACGSVSFIKEAEHALLLATAGTRWGVNRKRVLGRSCGLRQHGHAVFASPAPDTR